MAAMIRWLVLYSILEEKPVGRIKRYCWKKYQWCIFQGKGENTNVGLLKDKSQSSCTRVETTQVDRYKRMSSRIVGGGAKQDNNEEIDGENDGGYGDNDYGDDHDGGNSGSRLHVHMPSMHMVPFNEINNLEEVAQRSQSQRSMLTEYFRMNREDPNAPKYLYREFPEHFRWIKSGKHWKPRKNKRFQIGRLVYAHPAEGDRYYLRVLLNHGRGETSFAALRTVRGMLSPTFRKACEVLGLVETDKSLDDALTKATSLKRPCALRRLVATIIVFCEYTNIRELWDKHFESMAEDYRRTHGSSRLVLQLVLRDIADIVYLMGKDIRSYGLPELDESDDKSRDYYRELIEERKIGFKEEDLEIIDTLNAEQRAGFNEILDHVVTNRGKVFFVDGPGGTGKTYLYRALLAKVRFMDLIAITTATSGIAASIMPGGRTAHSRFKIPIKLGDNSVCNFTTSLIIWDEVAMTRRQAVETLDRSLQDIMGCTEPFGGKVMVFGGDFRQVLPAVPHGTRAQINDATLQRSYIWDKVRMIRLQQNMRAQSDSWYSDFLLRIGNGIEETYTDDYVQLPVDIVMEYNSDKSIDTLIEHVFPDLKGKEKVYYSHDSLMVRGFEENAIDAEIVNGQHAGNRVFLPRIPLSPSEDYTFIQVQKKASPNQIAKIKNAIKMIHDFQSNGGELDI
nr:uncharacterized protein LOC117835787 [Setaria viridis]